MKAFINTLQGLSLITADNAESGIDLARQQRPDLILMDIDLPEMDGIEATRRLG